MMSWRALAMRPAYSIAQWTAFATLGVFAAASGCGKSTPVSKPEAASPAGQSQPMAAAATSLAPITPDIDRLSAKPIDPMVVLHTSQGDVTIRLFSEKAPRTVENFLRGY